MRKIEVSEKKLRMRGRSVVAVLAGSAILAGLAAGESERNKELAEDSRSAVAQAAGELAMWSHPEADGVDDTITGVIETRDGAPVKAIDHPEGDEVIEKYNDGTSVEILCQAPGQSAPGDPADFGKPPQADTTWYRLGNPKTGGTPFNPERWIPQNPVFTSNPIPSCPR
jgi:hypothetical protein